MRSIDGLGDELSDVLMGDELSDGGTSGQLLDLVWTLQLQCKPL